MRNWFIVLFLGIICICGCDRQCSVGQKDVVARINNYEVTRAEFEKEFAVSSFGKKDSLESRKEFLNNLINRKLILQDAEVKGLDKDPKFLGMIQRFWEQSLLKLAIEKKTKEIVNSSFVSDKTVEEVYKKMSDQGKTDKPYSEMSQQIRWEIIKLKESQMIGIWLADMRSKAKVNINYDLLDKNKQGE